jgi:hypothetical protein
MEDEREFLSDGLNLSYTASSFEPTTMQQQQLPSGSNDILHHYSFLQPNKQIVSVSRQTNNNISFRKELN